MSEPVPIKRPSGPVKVRRSDPRIPLEQSGERLAERRHASRRAVYLGEGLNLRVHWEGPTVEAEGIDVTPHGIGAAVTKSPSSLPPVGSEVMVEYSGLVARGLRLKALVTHVTEGPAAGRRLPRLGLSFVDDHARPGPTPVVSNRRVAARFRCPEFFPALASSQSPVFFREWIHFKVVDFGARGMTLATSARNKEIVRGMEMDFQVTLPLIGAFTVRGRVSSVKHGHGDGERYRIGVLWLEPTKELLGAVGEYVLLAHKDVTPASLREMGFRVDSMEKAVSFRYAQTKADFDAILQLRAHCRSQPEPDATRRALVSRFDAHARHIVCRFGDRVVGSLRLIYAEGSPERSEYADVGHVMPDWLWEAGFCEGGTLSVHPDFQRADLYLALLRHGVRTVMQSGLRYVTGASDPHLAPTYERVGFRPLETRMVTPVPGWTFESRLFVLDTQEPRLREAAGDGLFAPVFEFVDRI